MQFHLNGYRSGDPDIAEAIDQPGPKDEVDVLIVGCGPAGLTLAAQLSQFPTIRTGIIEQKPGPLEVGQADGVACRTMEMFEAFGFAHRIAREAYWVNEAAFWTPDPDQPEQIIRSGRIDDVEDDLSEMPHTVLNQARVQDFYLEVMRNAPTRLTPDYGCILANLTVDRTQYFPVTATVETGGNATTIKARYIIGCDGARSAVRRAISLKLTGDAANKAWGVMDLLATTDFPDVRLKALVRSASEGSALVIPREGGYMFRLYIELDKLNADERVADRDVTANDLIAAANRIFAPYSFDVKEIPWWSVYEIGQRICDRFDDDASDPCVFIAGDACHTHSPKAGQGMNISMQDAFNLGWKLAAVLEGRSPPKLLSTYSAERQTVAQDLIDFDRAFASLLSAEADPAKVQHYFTKHGRYTAGVETQYKPSIITAADTHQALASGLIIGKRFHSAPVIRLADAKPMQLGHVASADGRWRLYLFADEEPPIDESASIWQLCDELLANAPKDADLDSKLDVRATFQQPHRDLSLEAAHPFLLLAKGRYGLKDYEKMFCVDPSANIYKMRGIDPGGAMVLVRPDQYVAHVLPLNANADLQAFLGEIML